MNDQAHNPGLWPVPGEGVLARQDDLILLSSLDDYNLADTLIDLLVKVAASGADGRQFCDLVADALDIKATSAGGGPDEAGPSVVAFGPAGAGLAVTVSGAAWAEVRTTSGLQRLDGGQPGMLLRCLLRSPVLFVRAGLGPDGKTQASTDRFSRLDGGTVRAGGLAWYPGDVAASWPPADLGRPGVQAAPRRAAAGERPERAAREPEPVAGAAAELSVPHAAAAASVRGAEADPAATGLPAPDAGTAVASVPPVPAAPPALPAEQPAADEPGAGAPGQAAAGLMPAGLQPGGPMPARPAEPAADEPATSFPAAGQDGDAVDLGAGLAAVVPAEAAPEAGGLAALGFPPAAPVPVASDPGPQQPFDAVLLVGAGAAADASIDAEPRAPLPGAAEVLRDPTIVASGPVIQGVYCKNGHFDDPEARYCAVCGISMNQQTLVPRPGPRPPLGVLVMDDGSVFQLDHDYVLGREPTLDATVAAGAARPLRIRDDAGIVSRVHARVHLDGWRVLLTDLGSANGTRLLLPDQQADASLQPQIPVALVPGSQVDLGGRGFRYESHRGR